MIKNIDLTVLYGRDLREGVQVRNIRARFIDAVAVSCIITITACWTALFLRALGLIQL